MKMVINILIAFCIMTSVCSSQNPTDNEKGYLNKLNENNKKEGLWIDTASSIITETYYKDGIKQGVFKSYYRTTGKLYGIGKYNKGVPTGTWFAFSETGHLWREESQFEQLENNNVKSFLQEFDLSGNLNREGWVVYDDTELLEYTEIGEWKNYSE